MFCSRCGSAVSDGDELCADCGASLSEAWLSPQDQPTYNNCAPTKKKNHAALAAAVSFLAAGAVFAMLIASGVIPVGTAPLKERDDEAAAPPPKESREQQKVINGDELLDYFCDVALNVEYGSADEAAKRWEVPLKVEVYGDYTREDYKTLEDHIKDLNSLEGPPCISIVDSGGNFFIYFVPLDDMDDVLPEYVEENWGFFYLYWDGDYEINKAYMGIATDVTTQAERNHLILEEFTQSLGLMNDSTEYEDSIFQANWTQTQELCDIDFELIRMLYSDGIEAGMYEPEVRQALSGWLGPG